MWADVRSKSSASEGKRDARRAGVKHFCRWFREFENLFDACG